MEDYEEDEGYQEEEEDDNQEEEPPQLTKEQLDYLEKREKLKAMIRRRMIKENGLVVASSKEKTSRSPGSFGSFFGPSQPVIAKRVIEEGHGLMDLRRIVANGQKTTSQGQRNNGLSVAKTNSAKSVERKQLPKVVDRVKLKAQKLKEARDYSFLLSGEEFPAPVKEELPPPRKTIPASDSRSSLATSSGRMTMSNKINHQAHSVQGKSGTVAAGKTLSRVGLQKTASSSKQSTESRKLSSANAGVGPGQPLGTKASYQKSHGSSLSEKKISHAMNKTDPSFASAKSPLPKQQVTIQKSYLDQGKQPLKSDRTSTKVITQRSVHAAKIASHQHSTASTQRLKFGSTSLASQRLKPVLANMSSERLKYASANMASQPAASIKQQNVKPMMKQPSKPISDNRPKKRPIEEYNDEDEGGGGDYRSMIRQMFRYDPKKYSGADEDDSDMEVGFNHIQAEERRSAKIAREEDERELALIEEEERWERQRKRLKMKHSQR